MVKNIVFSSSATVTAIRPLSRSPRCPKGEIAIPYGRTKGNAGADSHGPAQPTPGGTSCCCVFNPIGAHESSKIGEDPEGFPQQPGTLHRAGGSGVSWSAWACSATITTHRTAPVRDYIHVVDWPGPCEQWKMMRAKGVSIYNPGHRLRLQHAGLAARLREGLRQDLKVRGETPP